MIEKFMSQMLTKVIEAINPFLFLDYPHTNDPPLIYKRSGILNFPINKWNAGCNKKNMYYIGLDSRESVWQSSKESILVDYDEEIMSHNYISIPFLQWL